MIGYCVTVDRTGDRDFAACLVLLLFVDISRVYSYARGEDDHTLIHSLLIPGEG
jgi:hypothetical protein